VEFYIKVDMGDRIKSDSKIQRDASRWQQRWVRLHKKTKGSLAMWRRIMNRAEDEARPGDARTAREQVLWLRGYQRALNDMKQANEKVQI